uniref:J domain-containing protein n=1 Tax=Pseudo-nitzschia australis TaxID=44445 RepID=A0A7S4EQU9_9STRA|mmetsp:Transcript_4875/g.10755  ORF Transcript_4875/g.10755 Transcript_4875/m.10755 type:complete len:316 (-) Transcript_4875:252-1199(-)|eukprot:CAMPEP_0168194068 /NCGR_PEP_ID=MMETSP0139_2-20121125/18979_1 /TAXON_ID=44445 /ORGANISM="Pseudo-nitzschia australis, Strain 10249 10 AB" /LENGTH=315 /DNA_ID=CAMNT_0008117539 /DNA_START=74 /DNA_END=1021 /DNA_ORIENTATION=-
MASVFQQAFGTGELDLYEDVLHASKDCSPSQLRKAYYKQALKFHPDKNKSKEAKLKFQAISLAYSFLKDPKKRKEYDRDGVIPFDDEDDETNEQSRESWKEYFDLIFGKLSTDDIDSFAQKYKMSDEEEKDVLDNYVKFKGNLKKMLEFVMLSEERDVARWIEDYIQPAIENNKVEKFEAMLKKTRSQIEKKIAQEKTEKSTEDIHDDPDETETEDSGSDYGADDNTSKQPGGSKIKAKNGKQKAVRKGKSTKIKTKPKSQKRSSEEDLIAAIRNKNGRGNPLASIAARYGVSSMEDDPLDDANFEKLRSKYLKK